MKKSHLPRLVVFFAPPLLAAALFAYLTSTDPAAVGVGGILLVFLLIYLLSLSLLFVVLHLGVRWVSSFVAQRRQQTTRSVAIGSREAYYVASIVAFVPVVLIAMQSFAQLRWLDITLVVAFVAIATFYIVKRA